MPAALTGTDDIMKTDVPKTAIALMMNKFKVFMLFFKIQLSPLSVVFQIVICKAFCKVCFVIC